MLDVTQLSDDASYCVMRNVGFKESIILNGRYIKRHAPTSDFKRCFLHFSENEWASIPGYVRVRISDDLYLALWLDPSRPELGQADGGYVPCPHPVAVVNVVRRTQRLVEPDVLVFDVLSSRLGDSSILIETCQTCSSES